MVVIIRRVALLASALFVLAVSPALGADVGYLGSWSAPGPAAGTFGTINDVGVDASGAVVVLDRISGQVQRFSADGQLLGSWQAHVPAVAPQDLAVDGDGDIYVSNTGAVKIFDASGTLLQSVGAGTGWVPIAVDAPGRRLYVTAGSGLDVLDAQSGATLGRIEMAPLAPPHGLIGPFDVAVDAGGDVHVLTVAGNVGTVWTFRPDGTLGGSFPIPAIGPDTKATGIAANAAGDVFVLLRARADDVLQRFAADGALLQEFHRCAARPGQPGGIGVSTDGRIYAALGPRIDVYGAGGALTPETTCPPAAPAVLNPPAQPPVIVPRVDPPRTPPVSAPKGSLPKPVITIATRRAVVRRGGVFGIAVRCRAARGTCRVNLTVVAGMGRRRATLAQGPGAIRAGTRRTVELTLTRKGRGLLARSRAGTVRATLGLTASGGIRASTPLTLSRAAR